MKELKNLFKALKSWWSNPKLKGVVQLVFWIVFFIILAVMVRVGKNNGSSVNNSKSNDTNANANINTAQQNNGVYSYEFEYNYTDNDVLINVLGTHYNNKESFTLNNTRFYLVDDKYYDATNRITTINYALNEWQYNNLKMIHDHNTYSNLTKFKAGIDKYEYTLSKEVYNNYYGTSYPNDVIIAIYKSGDIINSATINYGFGNVEIKYTSINEIDGLDIKINR